MGERHLLESYPASGMVPSGKARFWMRCVIACSYNVITRDFPFSNRAQAGYGTLRSPLIHFYKSRNKTRPWHSSKRTKTFIIKKRKLTCTLCTRTRYCAAFLPGNLSDSTITRAKYLTIRFLAPMNLGVSGLLLVQKNIHARKEKKRIVMNNGIERSTH